ncbi:MAG: hypothetical protein IKG79_04065 [Neisseriaceae bacterium]|nr:hypothetical protein [Neisseriaceae bacterium]
MWLKDARVVCACIRTKGVSTNPHNNPPSNQNRQVKPCRFCLFISSLRVFQAETFAKLNPKQKKRPL